MSAAVDQTDAVGRELPKCRCPDCGYQTDAASDLGGGGRPQPDDVAICLECSAFLRFDAGMRVVILPPAVLRGLPAEQRELLFAARRAIHRMHAERR